ncbi:putative DCC family thiol-disulfide oxidoreductase YuxK [Melghiribacillus thermohalophilus]|uniref:Putative DCC family thiol-disulfide oxidoreductase YuxK n=1 Tax=Melghiribacillus thermohalophilus TaxID=1324956 RepID=A0A4V2V2V7_9BACI|nr:DUF393 domain-containing protein [Melghiribacillus thermohalophilus]TCT26691.1 putative DCC family thiol-disulfide oxidoreductase YuxK [Melghiribacillus thermohalophilus]
MKHNNQLLVFYDSWCPLCIKAKNQLEKADRRNRLCFYSIRDEYRIQDYNLDPKEAEKRMTCIDLLRNRRYSGIYSFREICRRIPRYYILVPLLQLTIWLGFGQTLYDWIAKRRTIIPPGGCSDDYCRVHPSIEHEYEGKQKTR